MISMLIVSYEAWEDAIGALERLKKKFFIAVLANGTTRLQLDFIRSSGLSFHSLFSSQLLGLTKPDPAIYLKVGELLQLRPEECMMVAAHAYDLRAAKKIDPCIKILIPNHADTSLESEFHTAYIHRSTEDLGEDMKVVRQEIDLFFDGRDIGKVGKDGLGELADLLGV